MKIKSKVPLPTDVSIITTYRCQMRCKMCSIWKYPSDEKKEISPKAIEKARQLNSAEYADLSLNAREFAERNFSSGNHYSALMEIYSKV